MLDRRVKIKEVKDLGAGNHLLTLSAAEQASLVQPGQFVMLKCVRDLNANPLLRRPFSIFDTPCHARTGRPYGIDLLVKVVGAGSHSLAQLEPGDFIYALGPQGRPFHVPQEMRNRVELACLVAGGVGIAAMLLLAKRLMAQNVRPILFYGGRSSADLVLREHFEHLRLQIFLVTEDGTCGERGLVTAALSRFLQEHSRKQMRIYCCGPWAMMKAVHELAVRYGFPCEASLEARMGCSVGACLGCVVRCVDDRGGAQYLRVCQEGPVMTSRAIDWGTPPL